MERHWLKYWCNFPPHYPTKWPKEGKAEKAEKVQCLQVQHWETKWTNKPNSFLRWKQRLGFSIENCWKFQKLDWEHASPDLEIAWWPYLLQLRPSRGLTKKLINLNQQVEIYNGNGLIFFKGKKVHILGITAINRLSWSLSLSDAGGWRFCKGCGTSLSGRGVWCENMILWSKRLFKFTFYKIRLRYQQWHTTPKFNLEIWKGTNLMIFLVLFLQCCAYCCNQPVLKFNLSWSMMRKYLSPSSFVSYFFHIYHDLEIQKCGSTALEWTLLIW